MKDSFCTSSRQAQTSCQLIFSFVDVQNPNFCNFIFVMMFGDKGFNCNRWFHESFFWGHKTFTFSSTITGSRTLCTRKFRQNKTSRQNDTKSFFDTPHFHVFFYILPRNIWIFSVKTGVCARVKAPSTAKVRLKLPVKKGSKKKKSKLGQCCQTRKWQDKLENAKKEFFADQLIIWIRL